MVLDVLAVGDEAEPTCAGEDGLGGIDDGFGFVAGCGDDDIGVGGSPAEFVSGLDPASAPAHDVVDDGPAGCSGLIDLVEEVLEVGSADDKLDTLAGFHWRKLSMIQR